MKCTVIWYVILHCTFVVCGCERVRERQSKRVLITYWKQWAGSHPCFWHAAPADAQSFNIESEGSHSSTFACHGCKAPVNLQQRILMSNQTTVSATCKHSQWTWHGTASHVVQLWSRHVAANHYKKALKLHTLAPRISCNTHYECLCFLLMCRGKFLKVCMSRQLSVLVLTKIPYFHFSNSPLIDIKTSVISLLRLWISTISLKLVEILTEFCTAELTPAWKATLPTPHIKPP